MIQVHDRGDFSAEFVDTYEDTRVGYSASLAEEIAARTALLPSQVVVDLGSGTGLQLLK